MTVKQWLINMIEDDIIPTSLFNCKYCPIAEQCKKSNIACYKLLIAELNKEDNEDNDDE